MKKSLSLALLLSVLLAGCAQIKTLVTVHPDGSGFIDQTIVPTAAAQEILALMTESGDYFMDEAQLQAYAAQLGEGVTYDSHEPIEDGKGLRVRFRFNDIRTVHLEQDGPSDFITMEGMTSTESESPPPITFGFDAGSPATLLIHPAIRTADTESDEPPSAEAEEEALLQMRQFLKDARFLVALDVVGNIQETDAMHHDGGHITLMDIDFNEFLKDDALIKQIAAHPEPTPELLAILAQQGFRIELQETVRVVFE
jgi:hypothetical protein